MKILLTNSLLHSGTGTESYLYTLACYLRTKGHTVSIYAHHIGPYSNNFTSLGIDVIKNPRLLNLKINNSDNFFQKVYKTIKVKFYTNKYINKIFPLAIDFSGFDIVHIQHLSVVNTIYDLIKDIPKVFVSHGIIPYEEKVPNYIKFPMNGYIAVSEEIMLNMSLNLPKENKINIIRNFIDLKSFSSRKKINIHLKNILVISKNILSNKKYIDIINDCANELGANIEYIGYPHKVVKNTRKYIENADLVIGIGRCAYEAMAMGRNVIVLDNYGLDGIIDSENKFKELRKNNLSGRTNNYTNFTKNDLKQEFLKYNALQGDLNRNLIEKHNNISISGKDLEEIYYDKIEHA